jgi:hypothetical protein
VVTLTGQFPFELVTDQLPARPLKFQRWLAYQTAMSLVHSLLSGISHDSVVPGTVLKDHRCRLESVTPAL